jgi:hypothetical protein
MGEDCRKRLKTINTEDHRDGPLQALSQGATEKTGYRGDSSTSSGQAKTPMRKEYLKFWDPIFLVTIHDKKNLFKSHHSGFAGYQPDHWFGK